MAGILLAFYIRISLIQSKDRLKNSNPVVTNNSVLQIHKQLGSKSQLKWNLRQIAVSSLGEQNILASRLAALSHVQVHDKYLDLNNFKAISVNLTI